MKKIAITALTLIAINILATSCKKEYNCECDNFSTIVEASSESEAQTTCSAKGTGCDIQ
ncbi:MAG: hypothetical protein KDC07_12330 [Chitinophagaceae bacterium]|nr:hypothetical protein [Chitinophagaceae bacterium]MCB9046791.1 hypothetical protein [Chitinophagales bacterium]